MLFFLSLFARHAKHTRYSFPSHLARALFDARDALDTLWFLHQRRVQLRWDPRHHRLVVARELATSSHGNRSTAPEVVAGV